MTKTELQNLTPSVISKRIAADGDKRSIINGLSNADDVQASIKYGLPYKMSLPLDTTGVPVSRQDFNGLFHLLSEMHYYLMAGGKIQWSTSERDALGGYPNGAIVWHIVDNENSEWKSLVDNNIATPGTDVTKWIRTSNLSLEAYYPVGSIYMSVNPGHTSCPLAAFFGTWEKIEGLYLLASGQLQGGWTTGSDKELYNTPGVSITGGLPNHNHSFSDWQLKQGSGTGSRTTPPASGESTDNWSNVVGGTTQNASGSIIYGSSKTVRPPSLVVHMWKRVPDQLLV